ncbi:MAG: MATE family efflux transporter [bacterium]
MIDYIRQILKVGTPYMISTFFDATSFTLMVFIVSIFLPSGKELASIGSSIYIVWVLWAFSTAFSSGIVSLTSRFLGDKDIPNIVHLFFVTIKYSFFWYIFIIVFFNFFIIDIVFSLLKLEPQVIQLSKEVVKYYCYIIIFSILASIVFSILQGIMKTKEIMYITIAAVAIEILVVFWGIGKVHLSLLINLAWLGGELIRIIAGYYFLHKEKITFSINISKELGKSPWEDFKRFLEALYIGFPLKIGMLIFGSVYYIIISYITTIGQKYGLAEKAVAALTLSQRFEVLIWMLDAGLTIATSTLIGKTIGYQTFQQNKTQKIKQVKNILYSATFLGTILFLPIFFLFILYNQQILSIFIKDVEIVNIGKGYLFYTGLMGISMVYNSIFTGFFIAIGKTLPITIYLVIFSLLRIPLCSMASNFDHIWIFINLTNLLMTICLYFTYLWNIRRL